MFVVVTPSLSISHSTDARQVVVVVVGRMVVVVVVGVMSHIAGLVSPKHGL